MASSCPTYGDVGGMDAFDAAGDGERRLASPFSFDVVALRPKKLNTICKDTREQRQALATVPSM